MSNSKSTTSPTQPEIPLPAPAPRLLVRDGVAAADLHLTAPARR